VQEVAKTKGINFVNLRAFTLDRFGLEGWVDVQAELSAEDRSEIESALSIGWYPLALYARALNALDRVHGTGNLQLVAQLGKYVAERDLTTIHRAFLRMASPSFLLEQSAEYWSRYYDTGKWTIERLSSTRVRGSLEGWGCVDSALCREVSGYLAKAFELVGARNVRIDHTQCRVRGAPRCVFLGSWGGEAPRGL
jgi:predicted hydrocarbon binding protein